MADIKTRDAVKGTIKTIAWILSLIFDRLDVSGSIADYPRKLLSCHSSGFTGFLDCLSYRREIEVKMIVPFVH